MSNIIVTRKENVEHDSEDQMILTEEGIPKLIDPDDIGILTKSHPIMTLNLTQGEDGSTSLESGYTTRAEVYWDKVRNPSPSLHKPTDLVWMEFMQAEDFEDVEDDVDDSESEDDYEEVEPLQS